MEITLSDDFVEKLAERIRNFIPIENTKETAKEIMTESYVMSSECLDVSYNTLANYRMMGLKSTKIGGKRYYLLEDVKEFLRRNQM